MSGSGILVAIDGPSGSGKSTVAKATAEALNLAYLDTGAMYRALTWYCLHHNIDLDRETLVREAAERMSFAIDASEKLPRFLVGGHDVTEAIRLPEVTERVSEVARNLHVREWMATEQRRLMLEARAEGLGMVAEGRDITTVVCPEADVRILLVADEDERLRRRTLELYGKITPELLVATSRQIGERDRQDSEVSDFLEAAPGVITIDSSGMSVAAVVSEIVGIVGTMESPGAPADATQ